MLCPCGHRLRRGFRTRHERSKLADQNIILQLEEADLLYEALTLLYEAFTLAVDPPYHGQEPVNDRRLGGDTKWDTGKE